MTQTLVTTVLDAGARYGMHPSWRDFAPPLAYVAFEPDPDEAKRLSESGGMTVVAAALGREMGRARLNLHRHRGCSSLLSVNAESDWFKRYRPGEGDLVKTVDVPLTTLDAYARENGLRVDFLKIDTEGTELDVLLGGPAMLAESILGVRINTTFQEVYHGQTLFSGLHDFLVQRGFLLLNLDYFGRGTPRNGLFRNPDPLSPDLMRYGVLIGTDGVWIRDYPELAQLFNGQALAVAILKSAAFCFHNSAPDVAIDILLAGRRDGLCGSDDALARDPLYRAVRRLAAEFLGRYRVVPDHQWDEARAAFKTLFGLTLESGSRYWDMLRTL